MVSEIQTQMKIISLLAWVGFWNHL